MLEFSDSISHSHFRFVTEIDLTHLLSYKYPVNMRLRRILKQSCEYVLDFISLVPFYTAQAQLNILLVYDRTIVNSIY